MIGRFQSTLLDSEFCSHLVVAVIMIEGSKACKSLVGVQVQSPYVN